MEPAATPHAPIAPAADGLDASTWRALVEQAPDALFVVDRDDRVLLASARARALLGLPAGSSPAGRSVTDLFAGIAAPLARARAGGGRTDRPIELLVERPDGSESALEAHVSCVTRPEGPLVLLAVRDLAVRRDAQEVLEADRARSEFLSRMSHELRTPLNSVLGFAQLLRLGELDAAQLEAVDQILAAGRHLLGLLDEVLDLERLHTGRLEVSVRPVPLDGAVREVLELVGPLAASRDVDLDVRLGPRGADAVVADPQRLRQVLLNLATNAIKYNRRHGRVTVTCGGDARTIVLRVTDTGPGIPADKLDRLFTPFERLGIERTGIEGSGVGLSLSKQLVEAMGGAIGVESVPGAGSTFWVMLRTAGAVEPPATVEAVALDPELTAQLARRVRAGIRRVVYIEDSDANRRLVERLLWEQDGVELLTASRGIQGVALARLARADAILLDLHLPDRDGLDVLRDLRSDGRTAGTPVIVVSADATRTTIDRALEAGAVAYLTKPLDVAELFRTLEEAFADQPDRSAGDEAERRA